MRVSFSSLACLLFLLTACQSEKIYSLDELRSNPYNQLGLSVTPNLDRQDYLQLFERFQALSVEELQNQLSSQPQALHEASFGLYYLANAYANERQMEQALLYHEAAAFNYLNPQSYLKLAEREFFVTNDYDKAFRYLHYALELTRDITDNNRSHPIAENIKYKSQFLLEELEKRAAQGAFDRSTTWEELKTVMTDVINRHRKMYELPALETPS